MVDRIDRILFITGLATYLVGQIAINAVGALHKVDIPFDYIHALMLAGVILLIPFAARLPRTFVGAIASPVLIIGIVSVVAMCVLDFVFWALPEGEMRNDVAQHLISTAVIWTPFMEWGPNEIFTIGLFLPALMYWRSAKVGLACVGLGAISIMAGPSWFNVAGYCLMLIGYSACFMIRPKASSQ